MIRIFSHVLVLVTAGTLCAQQTDVMVIDDHNVVQALRETERLFDPQRSWVAGPRTAAIHRVLQSLSAEERYDLLKEYAFSQTDENAVHCVAAICNVQSPPPAFARVLGRRPRADVFAIPKVREVWGLFSSAWLLVDSAKEVGRLYELTEAIDRREGSRADYLGLLVALAGARGIDEESSEQRLASFIEQLAKNEDPLAMQAAVVAAVAAESEAHADWAGRLDAAVQGVPSIAIASKRLLREVVYQTQVDSAADAIEVNDDWIRMGSATPWYIFENHLAHWSARHSTLLFRYPLGGNFRCQVEQLGGHEKDLSSLGYEAVELDWENYRRPQHNQRVIEKADDTVRYWINGHPVKTKSASGTAPWLTLRSNGLDVNRFYNFSLSGSPRVLKEVNLIASDSRSGWNTWGVDDDAQCWSVDDGILRSMTTDTPPRPCLLRYMRPLLRAETFEYEFFAAQDMMVHPAIGRMVFLIQSDGVKLHWVTDEGFEWTGLPADNTTIEPLFRRGPRPLPLRRQQWNHLSLKSTAKHIAVALNGSVIYERPLESRDDTRVGLFHDRSREKVRVRQVKLHGDWPSEIDVEKVWRQGSEPNAARQRAVVDLFPEWVQQSNLRQLVAKARGMSPQDRYKLLHGWVMPGRSHSAFRVAGYFGPLRQPAADRKHAGDSGGRMVSPALQLIDLAKQLGYLDGLAEQLTQAPADNHDDRRARAALLTLVHAARGQTGTANEQLESLYRLVSDEPNLPSDQLWPELLIAHELGDRADTSGVLHDLLAVIDPHGFSDDDAIRSELLRVLQSIRFRSDREPLRHTPVELAGWTPTAQLKAPRRAAGGAPSDWIAAGGTIHPIGGQRKQQLFFDCPLEGDFEFQFEQFLRPRVWIHTLLGGVNHFCGSGQIKTGPIDGQLTPTRFASAVCTEGNWMHQRYVIRDGTCKIFANGRQVHEHPVVPGFPWLALRQDSAHSTTLRDLRVSGNPIIPERVRLDHAGMGGWHSYYRGESFSPGSPWQYDKGEVIGRRGDKTPGSGDEQLLCYQYPLPDESTLSYEFFYRPGEVMVHPAFDRTAFVIAPSGVGLHRVTDGYDDSTFHSKVNFELNAHQQRSSPEGLLRPDEWNVMKVSVRGDSVDLRLNGESIFAGQVNAMHGRFLGLFYYADQSSGRVKNVYLTGSWPRQMPGLQRQPLADQTVVQLDASSRQLNETFQHDFASDGLPAELFSIQGAQNARISTSGTGIGLAIESPNRWTQTALVCNLRMSGDFDVTADFSDLEVRDGDAGFANLVVPLISDRPVEARMSRVDQGRGKKQVNAQMQTIESNGGQTHVNHRIGWEAASGTLRIARRGKKLYFLTKNSDASQFRLIKSYDSLDSPTTPFRLMTIAHHVALSSVTWRRIEVRAEQLSQVGGAVGTRVILVGRGDGSDLRPITKPIGDLGTHGSPEFSPDGKMVAFDTWKGSARTAHILTVNADGSGLQDLGIGTMPTFSPDGKKIVFSTVDGMMMMDVDGSDRRVLSRTGWGVQMSPLGTDVAFTDYEAAGPNLYVLDLKTNRKRPLLSGQNASRYSRIYWNCDWSPDGREICFCADNRQTGDRELVIVSTAGSDTGFKVVASGRPYANITWHPDGERIIYSAHDPVYGATRLFVIRPDDPKFLERLLDDVRLQSVGGGDWSPDGSMFVVASAVAKNFSEQPKND